MEQQSLMFCESKSGKGCRLQVCLGAAWCHSRCRRPEKPHSKEPMHLSGSAFAQSTWRGGLHFTKHCTSAVSLRPLPSWPRASASSRHNEADGPSVAQVLPLCCFSQHIKGWLPSHLTQGPGLGGACCVARAGLPTRKPVHHVLPSLDLRPPHPEGLSECLREAGAQRGAATWWGAQQDLGPACQTSLLLWGQVLLASRWQKHTGEPVWSGSHCSKY